MQSETMDLDLVFLANFVADQKGGHVLTLVSLQLNNLQQTTCQQHCFLVNTMGLKKRVESTLHTWPSSVSSTTVPLQQKSFLKAFKTFL